MASQHGLEPADNHRIVYLVEVVGKPDDRQDDIPEALGDGVLGLPHMDVHLRSDLATQTGSQCLIKKVVKSHRSGFE